MAIKDLLIKVGVKGAKKAEKDVKGVDGALDKLGSVALKVSGAFFAAKGLIAGFSGVIEAAARQEQAEKALQVALGRTSEGLLKQASALQAVTTAGDEAIIEQQAFLASLKFTEDQIKNIIPVALDLSAATGISLESAVRNTSKTFSGLAGELGELVPQLRDLTKEEMMAGDAVKVLGDLFEGQASKQADTLSGSLEQAKNKAGDLAEAIGQKLSPFIKTLATDFTKAADSAISFIGPEAISKEEQFHNLLKQRNLLQGEDIKQKKESIEVASLFTDEALEGRAVEKEALSFGVEALDRQIEQFKELLFVKREEPELIRSNIELANMEKKIVDESFLLEGKRKKQKQDAIIDDLKNAALQQGSAKDAMKAVVRAESMEAVAGYIASVLKGVPFPLNVALEAGGGALVSGFIDKGLAQFADGGIVPGNPNAGDSVPSLLTPGEVILNQAQQDNLAQGMGGITLNVSAPLVDESIIDTIIPAIEKVQQGNLA